MSRDEVGIFSKACRIFACLAGGGSSGLQRLEAHCNGTLPKAPGQPAGVPQLNGSVRTSQSVSTASILRHNPIDVCLTVAEPVSVLQGNPSQRTYEASWCGIPVHLHVLIFVKRPNPIAQIPGPTSSHATVAAVLDAPPPAQANMIAQPDMIAVATEVEGALVQLIAEPTPQVLPVLACAKVICRAHIGSPGDEHVTQRIIAEVHIVTPRVPGLVSLSQWLHERWPQCDVPNASGGEAPAAFTAAPDAPVTAPGGAQQSTTSAAPLAGPPSASPQPSGLNPPSHRLAASTSAASMSPGVMTMGGAGSAICPGFNPGPSLCRLGASQPIAEGVTAREDARGGGEQHRGQEQHATAAAGRASSTGMAVGVAAGSWIPCLGSCFALETGMESPPVQPFNLGGSIVKKEPTSEQEKTAPVGPRKEDPATRLGAALAPATQGVDSVAGGRRLAGPATNTTLGHVRQRLPLPPPPPQRPKLPVPEALEVLICLAEVLRNLHRRGLTHGSLTPKTIQLQLVETAAAAAAAAATAVAGAQDGVHQQAPEAQRSCLTAQASGAKSQAVSPQDLLSQMPSHPQTPQEQFQATQSSQDASPGEVENAVYNSAGASCDGGASVGPSALSEEVPDGVSSTAAVAVKLESVSVPTAAETAAAGLGHQTSTEMAAPATAMIDDRNSTATLVPLSEGCEVTEKAEPAVGDAETKAANKEPRADVPVAVPALPGAADTGPDAAGGRGVGGISDASPGQPVVPVAPALSQRQKSCQPARRRQPAASLRGGIRAMLPLPAIGPAMLQLQTWGRVRPVGLPREHVLWCAPELLNGGGIGWGPPILARRSGNGSASMSLGPLDQSLGCRNGNRLRGGGHHSRHFGDGSYGGSVGGTSRRFRCASSLLVAQEAGSASPSANGITPSCDVYSLGMLMWYLVSGQAPFQHIATQDQVLRVKEIGSLDEQLPFSSELPAGYIQLARRCWAPLPMQRPSMNSVLSEMRSLRAQLLGLATHREMIGELGHGFGHGGSSMGEMTGESHLSFTLSLPLSSRDLSNGDDNYSLVRPPLELAFGANDASGGRDGVASGPDGGSGLAACSGAPPPPPPLLKTALPAALLSAFTTPRRGSAGGGSGLMDDDDNYSDTDRFTEHADTNDHTEPSGDGTPYSSPTAGTPGGGRPGVNGTSARLQSMTAAAAASAATARSFRVFRMSHRQGSTAGSVGRSGGNSGAVAASLVATGASRRGANSGQGQPAWSGICESFSGPMGGAEQGQQQQGRQQQALPTSRHLLVGRGSVHASIGKVRPSAAASLGARCASSDALLGLTTAPPPPSAIAALRFSLTQGPGSCGYAAAGSSNGGGGGAGGAGGSGGGGGGAGSSSSRMSAMITATTTSLGCLAVPCGSGSGGGSD